MLGYGHVVAMAWYPTPVCADDGTCVGWKKKADQSIGLSLL
jgi:hypothetical protein